MKASGENLDLFGLLYLVQRSGCINSRIRLQKLFCILEFNEKAPLSFEFKSHYYGPYSESIREFTDKVVRDGLVKEDKVWYSDDVFSYSYKLTGAGNSVLEKFDATDKVREVAKKVDRVVSETSKLTTEQIVRFAKNVSGIESTPG